MHASKNPFIIMVEQQCHDYYQQRELAGSRRQKEETGVAVYIREILHYGKRRTLNSF